MWPYRLRAWIEAHDVVRRSEHDTPHLLFSGSLEKIVCADDIRVEDCFPRRLGRLPAEMQNPIDAGGCVFDG